MDTKTRRQLMKAMQTESTWLQKALFALNKAEDARGTISELADDDLEDLRAPATGKWASMSDFRDVLQTRVETIMEELQEARRVTT